MILLSLAANNPSIIEEFMEQLIPTDNFLKEITLLTDAIKDSIDKPSKPFIAAINKKNCQ